MTLTGSIIAKNTDGSGFGPDIYADTNRSFTSGGNNRVGNATTGIVHNPSAPNGDHVGTPDYIVTSVIDTYDGSGDPVFMSLRDAIHRTNITSGTQTIWLPAWDFVLTEVRKAAPNLPEMDVAQGDLELLGSTIIRGIQNETSVAWRSSQIAPIIDKVFELVGDYNGDNVVNGADETFWQAAVATQNLAADGDDDGDVDPADQVVWSARSGNTLVLEDV